jgi:hypothetical protein
MRGFGSSGMYGVGDSEDQSVAGAGQYRMKDTWPGRLAAIGDSLQAVKPLPRDAAGWGSAAPLPRASRWDLICKVRR